MPELNSGDYANVIGAVASMFLPFIGVMSKLTILYIVISVSITYKMILHCIEHLQTKYFPGLADFCFMLPISIHAQVLFEQQMSGVLLVLAEVHQELHR